MEPAAVIRFDASGKLYDLILNGETVARSETNGNKEEIMKMAEQKGYTVEIEGEI